MSNLLADLNPAQREAVTATEGPLLVLAGAGSGKTRVITYRIAYLIEQHRARPEEILAVTFTNKAADEMRQRVERLVPGSLPGAPWTSTFHSFCARLLRREAGALGLRRDFSIYDEADQERVVRSLLKEFGDPEASGDRAWVARGVVERISRAKTAGRTPQEWAESPNPQERRQAELYRRYQEELRAAHGLDFDDLLLEAVRVLAEHAAVRQRWQQRFRYLHVDEYQDTNRPQYELIRLLANAPASGQPANVCVVGDEDQSIYGWRGADYGNIFRFEQDFPGTRLILLEQNYRSTQPILDAATAVIQHNRSRKGKVLWSEEKAGAKARAYEAPDAEAEAQFVAERLWSCRRQDPTARLAVLYRTNAQSRLYEEALRRLGLPYRVVGGFSFYKRAEVRDLLAYLRAARNPLDTQSLLRVINVPPRGLGPARVEALAAYARDHAIPLGEALEVFGTERVEQFRELLGAIRGALETEPFPEALEFILTESGYESWLSEQDTLEAEERLANLRELIAAAEESAARGEAVADFLDRAALTSDADDYDASAPITLMTLHSAKGTEFDVVFLVGLEEGLFPHSRALDTEADIEEERRLCYVGMTRAKRELYLLRALERRSWGGGESAETEPSRFLLEVPESLVERLGLGVAVGPAGGEWRYEMEAETSRARRAPRRRRSKEDALLPHPARHRLDPRYPLGCTVRHARFGEGTVLAVDGEGADRKIVVHFPNYGRKTLVEKYAGLERV